MRMREREREREREESVCVCVCVRVCSGAWRSERDRKRRVVSALARKREGKRVREF